MSPRVLVLGSTGMLGNALLHTLLDLGIDVTGTTRTKATAPDAFRAYLVEFDVTKDSIADVVGSLGSGDYVVNCIGVIKHHMDDTNASHRLNAIKVNSIFPYELVQEAESRGFHVIQIATDCVYSGSSGDYSEESAHDATDVYGQTKSLGEVPSGHLLNLRCSIIGRELSSTTSLLEWVLSHAPGTELNGYTDHFWNGVTTTAFAEIAAGLIKNRSTISGTHHILPADSVNKATLVRLILEAFNRTDITVADVQTGGAVDRTLSTIDPNLCAQLWTWAGYAEAPTVKAMVDRLAAANSRLDSERTL